MTAVRTSTTEDALFFLLQGCQRQRDKCLKREQGLEEIVEIRTATIGRPPPLAPRPLPATDGPDVGLSVWAAIVIAAAIAGAGALVGIKIDRDNR